MIKANFKAYDSYITDSLYQWDINQELTVSGLNLSVVPEVHFSNHNTDRAIVKQATMSNHIVTVRIPNSLLQEPFTIYAHIGIYEGDTFKVVEKIEIPVTPKERPKDYQIQDTDEELYSFKALENKMGNMATVNHVNQVNARISNIIANASETGENSELIDIRISPTGTVYPTAGDAVRASYMYSDPITIQGYNYLSKMPTINISTPGIFKLLFEEGSTDIPANLPFTSWPGGIASLIVTNGEVVGNNKYVAQTLITRNNVYYRYTDDDFSDTISWYTLGDCRQYVKSNPVMIMAGNYKKYLPTVNIVDASIYKMIFTKGSTNIPEGLPFTEWEGATATLITVNSSEENSEYYGVQILFTTENIYYRYANNEYQTWINLSNKIVDKITKTINITPDSNLVTVLKNCYKNGYKKVIFEKGTYDIIADYKNYYSFDFFTDYEGYSGQEDKFYRGLWLEDIEIVFSPGAKVVCKYSGDNDNVKNNFSAFAIGNNVIIDGLVLDSENLLYGIHADYNTGTNVTDLIIRNSDLRHYKSDADAEAIGAGFGIHVNWLIENTIFRSQSKTQVLRVHNNVNDTAQSKLVIRNCYIEGEGFFKFNYYSTSPLISSVMVCGCSYITEPVVDAETTDSTVKNISLIAFNNEVRSS